MTTKPCGYTDTWFAWRPVRLGYTRNREVAWLETLKRTKRCHYATPPWWEYERIK